MSRHDWGRRAVPWVVGYAIVGSLLLIGAAAVFLFYLGGLAGLHP
jgi:hypothetical protein